MYRCAICQLVSQPGMPQLRHVVKRPDGQIHREIPVCAECHEELRLGVNRFRVPSLRKTVVRKDEPATKIPPHGSKPKLPGRPYVDPEAATTPENAATQPKSGKRQKTKEPQTTIIIPQKLGAEAGKGRVDTVAMQAALDLARELGEDDDGSGLDTLPTVSKTSGNGSAKSQRKS